MCAGAGTSVSSRFFGELLQSFPKISQTSVRNPIVMGSSGKSVRFSRSAKRRSLVVDLYSGQLHVKIQTTRKLECGWTVQKRSSKGTTTTARETWRARCEDGCFIKTQPLTADLMTQVLSHARKIHVCRSAECAQVWCCVYTLRHLQGNRHCL